jgi:hypothetical protein
MFGVLVFGREQAGIVPGEISLKKRLFFAYIIQNKKVNVSPATTWKALTVCAITTPTYQLRLNFTGCGPGIGAERGPVARSIS